VKLDRLGRPKISCSSSYADYRPKTNAIILRDTGQLRESCTWERQETKNLNVVDMLSVQERI
jgi:hypothetical protein